MGKDLNNIYNCIRVILLAWCCVQVIGACGGPDKCALLKEKGAMEAIDYRTENIKNRMKEITDGDGANVILDNVGGDTLNQCLRR